MFDNPFILIISAILLLAAGWALRLAYEKYKPSERTVALKAANQAITLLTKLNGSPATSLTPAQVADAAAVRAKEETQLAQLKAQVAALK